MSETTTEIPPPPEPPPDPEIERLAFMKLASRYGLPWLAQVAMAPKDPASRAIVLANTHVYPDVGFTAGDLAKILCDTSQFPTPPVQAPLPTAPISSMPQGIVIRRNATYQQGMSDIEQAQVPISRGMLDDCVSRAATGASGQVNFIARLETELKALYQAMPANLIPWRVQHTHPGEYVNGTRTEHPLFMAVRDDDDWRGWALALLERHQAEHPGAAPLAEDLEDWHEDDSDSDEDSDDE